MPTAYALSLLALQNRPMNSADLSRDQVDKLLTVVTPMLGYLTRLSDRMDKRGMGTEPLTDSVRKAQHAMQELRYPTK